MTNISGTDKDHKNQTSIFSTTIPPTLGIKVW